MVHAVSLRIARIVACAVASVAVLVAASAEAQVVVYEPLRPVVSFYSPWAAGYPGGYVANYSYSPAGNYAAVTAFSPPLAAATVANYVTETVAAPVAVTSFYAPAPPVVAAPITTYYAPAAVVPLYRRGPFGGLRPARTAMLIPY